MPDVDLKIRSVRRAELPGDTPLGAHLVEKVRTASGRGAAPPAVVVIRAEALDLLALQPLTTSGWAVHRFIAALTRSRTEDGGEVEAIGVMGRFLLRARGGGNPVPMVTVFLEWEDCRWWQWQALLDSDGLVRPDTETIRSAIDGDALPARLGRWWSYARRTGVRAQLRRKTDETVH